jgi:hypothetical protein
MKDHNPQPLARILVSELLLPTIFHSYFERSNLSAILHHVASDFVLVERRRQPLFIVPTMAQYDAIRYSPLGTIKSYTTSWISSRRKGLPKIVPVALFLAVVIIFGTSIAAYNDYISHIAEKRIPRPPNSPRITIASTVTVTSSPTLTGI